MSTLKVLKEYLVGDGGYLLNDDNNGKTVMLSGAWGSGKTHFWLEDIKTQLKEKEQKNIYISLYGKESIGELKFEVLREAYNLEVEEDFISKTAAMISSIAPSLGEKSLIDGYDKLNKKAKEKKAEEILKSGSIICLDDFERKSTKIDLNDLFGYISQLALDYKCKVVIILNSDVFEGEEANVFKRVKEKSVNKFFYFEPTIDELFNSIYKSDNRYKRLDEYKADILGTIQETKELNARIYIQVLDNCIEWIEKGYKNEFLRILVLTTISFISSGLVLSYPIDETKRYLMSINEDVIVSYNELEKYHSVIRDKFSQSLSKLPNKTEELSLVLKNIEKRLRGKTQQGTFIFSEIEQSSVNQQINDDTHYLKSIWKYGYQLYPFVDVNQSNYEVLSKFIETGILLPKENL